MQVTLTESRRTRKRTGTGTIVSALLHGAVLAVAVAGTGRSEPARFAAESVDTLVYTPPTPKPVADDRRRGAGSASGAVPVWVPPIPQLPMEVAPVVDLGIPLPQTPVARGEFVPWEPGSAPGGAPTRISGEPMDSAAVDRVVSPRLGNPAPRYPQVLRAGGVEGSVVARFVVDTLGMVEPRSVVVVRSTHAQFEQAVREVMPRWRFAPAEVRGVRVRQLVEQVFQFELERSGR